MIIDFCNTCNSYDENKYKKNDFSEIRCPKCSAVGLFNKHAYYIRNVIFFAGIKLKKKKLLILRVICDSCDSTHAVLPYDIVPYKLVTSVCILKILIMIFVQMISYVKILSVIGVISIRLISQYKKKFLKNKNEIVNFLRNIYVIPPKISPKEILNEINSIDYKKFLEKYIEYNGKTLFMEKLQNKSKEKSHVIVLKKKDTKTTQGSTS